MRRRHTVWLFLALLVLGLAAVYITSDVSTALTEDDKTYAARILRDTGHGAVLDDARPTRYDQQIATILAVQDAVLTTAPKNKGLPLGQPRELRDLYEAKRGLCYDRSRAIEKILESLGFETRHAAVYSTKDASRLKALVTEKTPSHAVTEVKTDRGWLVIDSNRRWIGLTEDGKPVDLETLQDTSAGQAWDGRVKQDMSRILAGPFTYVIGLYSRHGRFYPPYTPVPDVDWGQLGYNFGG
jgi:transglutaminase superfamily protein